MKMTDVILSLQKGDEFRGSSQGLVYHFRNGCDLGRIKSGMGLIQNYQAFLSFAKRRAEPYKFGVRPRKDPWILEFE